MITRNDRMNMLFAECEQTVLGAIIKPFGLSNLIFQDKDGGYVDTIHNVRTGVWVDEVHKQAYDMRQPYDSDVYHKAAGYKRRNAADGKVIEEEGRISDGYSTNDIKRGDKRDLDHKISAKETSDDAGRVLAGVDGGEIANRDTNLCSTNAHINRTKKAMSMEEYIAYRKTKVSQIESDIARLEEKSKGGPLTPGQSKQLEKLKESRDKYANDGFDEAKAREEDRKAREAYNNEINRKYYLSADFAKDLGIKGLSNGIKMGLQQVLGLFLQEFSMRAIREVRVICHTQEKNSEPIFKRVKDALKRIFNGMTRETKWKNVLATFARGGIGGFLSTIVTTLINAFATTAKNLVRAIRESCTELVGAFKVLIMPPEGATNGDVGRLFFKGLSTAIILGLGVAIEGALHTALDGMPFGQQITMVLMAILTGVSVALAGFIIDCWFDVGDNLLESYQNFCKLGSTQRRLTRSLLDITRGYVESAENFELLLRKERHEYAKFLLMKESVSALQRELDLFGGRIEITADIQEKTAAKLEVLAADVKKLIRRK